jgi:hypothetical protein
MVRANSAADPNTATAQTAFAPTCFTNLHPAQRAASNFIGKTTAQVERNMRTELKKNRCILTANAYIRSKPYP